MSSEFARAADLFIIGLRFAVCQTLAADVLACVVGTVRAVASVGFSADATESSHGPHARQRIGAACRAFDSHHPSSASFIEQEAFVMTNQSNEEREGQESIDRVLRVFQIIWSNWERTNRYSYEIFSREKVVGRHLNDIRNVKHWVGAGGKGEELNLNELVAVFRLIGSQYEQVGFIKHHAKPSVRSTVNLRPTDAEIITTLRQLRVAEPVDESDDK